MAPILAGVAPLDCSVSTASNLECATPADARITAAIHKQIETTGRSKELAMRRIVNVSILNRKFINPCRVPPSDAGWDVLPPLRLQLTRILPVRRESAPRV